MRPGPCAGTLSSEQLDFQNPSYCLSRAAVRLGRFQSSDRWQHAPFYLLLI